MDVERRLIIMRRIAGAVGTAVLQILKWMLKIVLGALKPVSYTHLSSAQIFSYILKAF